MLCAFNSKRVNNPYLPTVATPPTGRLRLSLYIQRFAASSVGFQAWQPQQATAMTFHVVRLSSTRSTAAWNCGKNKKTAEIHRIHPLLCAGELLQTESDQTI